MYTWSRSLGYECSTAGDKRFSALCARMPDGRTIEEHYQCDIKGYDPGGTNWRAGKGKPPLDPNKNTKEEYICLWRVWAKNNPELIAQLKELLDHREGIISDRFANTEINQAMALCQVLNEMYGYA